MKQSKEKQKISSAKYYAANKEKCIAAVRASKALSKARLKEYLSAHPCVDCGENDPIVLEFDHVRGVKTSEVYNLAVKRGWAWKRVLTEIAKCEVRCANCHRRVTHQRRQIISPT